MKLLGSNEDSGVDSGNSRPQIRTSQDDAAGYGFHPPQENLSEFPAAFVPKRWTGTDDLVEVSFSLKNHFNLCRAFLITFPDLCVAFYTNLPHTNNTFLILLHILFVLYIPMLENSAK